MSVHLGYWFGMKVTEAEKVEMLVNKDVIVRQSLPPTPDTTSLHEHHVFYQVMDRKNLQKVAINPETWAWQIKNGIANQD